MTDQIAVIGAGAAGIAAAAELSKRHIKTVIFEKNDKPLKKLLATGNGRCNFSNTDKSRSHFFGDEKLISALTECETADTERFFAGLGLFFYEEAGRLYPRSRQASSVRTVLLGALSEQFCEIRCGCNIVGIGFENGSYNINGEKFDAVIMATGSAAGVNDYDNTLIDRVAELGHTFKKFTPALCGLVSGDRDLHVLAGVREKGKVSVFCGEKPVAESFGEIQFNEKYVSGIPVMDLSRCITPGEKYDLFIDFANDIGDTELTDMLRNSALTTEDALSGVLNSKLAYILTKRAGIEKGKKAAALSEAEVHALLRRIRGFSLRIDSPKGFDNAQISNGGFTSDTVDGKTLSSKIYSGMFFCGEMLNAHGDCGGYNLHLAWTSGRLAAKSASEYIKDKQK